MPDRDLFANFERMRREMDELFGDVFERTGLGRKRAGFSPAVDVIYASDPPRAIVAAELAGVDVDDLEIELKGSQLTRVALETFQKSKLALVRLDLRRSQVSPVDVAALPFVRAGSR